MNKNHDIDPTDLLEPSDDWTAKSLRGRYSALEDEGITVRCVGCHTEPETPETVVAAFPQPWTDDGPWLLCASCWAVEAAESTTLGVGQCKLLALRHAGLSIPEMSSATMRDEDEIEEDLRVLTKRAESVKGQVRRVQRTNGLLADVLG